MQATTTTAGARRRWETEDVDDFRENARRFFERECVPNRMRWREQGYADRAAWNRAGAAGLLCASIPEAYGGGGGSFVHEAVIAEEQALSMSQGLGTGVHSGIVAHYILAYGSEEQKLRWLPRMATGELVAAIALTEPAAGTDLQRIRTRGRRVGAEWRIDGNKTFITNGLHAGIVCVAARTEDAPGAKGISLIIVETEGLAGYRCGEPLHKIGLKAQDTVELFFDDVRVPAENLLGREGEGFRQMMEQLPQERMLIGLTSCATMQRAIGDTLRYVREREVFGAPLLKLQNTRFKLAECETRWQVTRAFVDDCVVRLLEGTLDVPTAAMSKWWASENCWQVVDECLQLHGGYGFMDETPIAQLYTDVRVTRIFGGANEVMKEIVARHLETR